MNNGPIMSLNKLKYAKIRGGFSKNKSKGIIQTRMADEFRRRLSNFAMDKNVRSFGDNSKFL
jgi:hypothetical protein